MPTEATVLEVDGRAVRITNPSKVFFPASGTTKLDLANYYVAVRDGVLRGARDRPTTLYRWPNGVDAPDDAFYQKRLPDKGRPEWLESVVVRFPSGRQADMLVIADLAHLLWAVNLGCIDLNPWPVRRGDVDHPDELRVDLDPTPGIDFADVRKVAMVAKEVLEEHSLVGWPKTSGKRGIHVYVRIEPRWDFQEVRRAALAFAREVERRAGGLATTAWWKEERTGVFVDYNQNARDRTIAAAYSVRPFAAAQVSCPLRWDEVPEVDPTAFTIATVPERVSGDRDPHRGIDDAVASLDPLLELADADEAGGLGDAPWPPHFPKSKTEPVRAAPSRRKIEKPKAQGRRKSGS
ncbi:MAG TPA: DNA polymerase domain-containing protein [Actinomycetota bacterium]|nr:DNA polymerase domain-containing protein [Actinomycetota bacterium]